LPVAHAPTESRTRPIRVRPSRLSPSRSALPITEPDPQLEVHRRALRGCARRLLGSDAEAEAVTDEMLAAAARAIPLFRPSGNLGAWLQGLVVGAALTRLRSGSRGSEPRWPGPIDEAARRDPGDTGPALLEALSDPVARARVVELAGLLPMPLRAVFVLAEIEALEIDDAALLLGIDPETVVARLARSRAAVRAWLEDGAPDAP